MDDGLLSDFLVECREHLEGIEADLLAIEEAGQNADPEIINKVFRAAHSIKGGAGFFNLTSIKTLAHRTETVLDLVRSRRLFPNAEVINILLGSFDKLRDMVNNINELNQFDISLLIESLQMLLDQHQEQHEKGAHDRNTTLKTSDGKAAVQIPEIDVLSARKERQFIYMIEYDLIHDIDNAGKSAINLLNSLSKIGVIIDSIFDISKIGSLDDEPANSINVNIIYRTVLDPDMIDGAVEVSGNKIHLLFDPRENREQNKVTTQEPVKTTTESVIVNTTSQIKKPVEQAPDPQLSQGEPVVEKNTLQTAVTSNIVPDTIRINVSVLDILMSQVGELVLGRNNLLEAVAKGESKTIDASVKRLSFVISELQESVMRTRLQPIGNVFNKFPRVVRDLARTLGKDVKIEVEGRDVELDKTIIEGLSDPLTHMVRNAVDHGIESPDKRVAANKPASGTLILRAFHEAGQVTIEVADDGNGIDGAKVAKKALSLGLITAERLAAMSDDEKLTLIFLPGLSTSDKITETSGRGVGMDVVKTNLDHLGGKVEIHSQPGKGTTFRIKLPLTLAIIPSLIIVEELERFAIPQVNVNELISISASQVKEKIEIVGDAEVLVLRGELIPLVRLAKVLGIEKTYIDPETGERKIDRRKRIADRRSRKFGDAEEIKNNKNQGSKSLSADNDAQKHTRAQGDRRSETSSDLHIVVVASGSFKYGLVVDDMRNTEEIVVKPLGRHFKERSEYAGATIMGDGEVALILDLNGIASNAHFTKVSSSTRAKKLFEDESERDAGSGHSLLIFDNMPGEKCGIALNLVERVERIEPKQVEFKGGRRSMQYRGTSLPLVQLCDAAKVSEPSSDNELAVIVTSIGGHEIGMLGRMPVAVVDSIGIVDTETHRQRGISGSTIIDNDTILIVDIFEIVDTVYPQWSIKNTMSAASNGLPLLLVEDSDFFRTLVSRHLTDAGFNVTTASDGLEAWDFLQTNQGAVKLVVTDIEMPRMNGLELAQKIRTDKELSSMPLIALTTLAAEEEIARGKQAGIDEYQVKLDRDELIKAIHRVMKDIAKNVAK